MHIILFTFGCLYLFDCLKLDEKESSTREPELIPEIRKDYSQYSIAVSLPYLDAV